MLGEVRTVPTIRQSMATRSMAPDSPCTYTRVLQPAPVPSTLYQQLMSRGRGSGTSQDLANQGCRANGEVIRRADVKAVASCPEGAMRRFQGSWCCLRIIGLVSAGVD